MFHNYFRTRLKTVSTQIVFWYKQVLKTDLIVGKKQPKLCKVKFIPESKNNLKSIKSLFTSIFRSITAIQRLSSIKIKEK